MNEVKIIRLKNGSDVIGFVTEKLDKTFLVLEPMEIILHTEGKYSGLILKQWLPASLIKLNEANISSDNIVCVMEANENFSKYYSESVIEYKERMKVKDNLTNTKESDINEIMEACHELANEEHIIH